jgi:hypothetical protein
MFIFILAHNSRPDPQAVGAEDSLQEFHLHRHWV